MGHTYNYLRLPHDSLSYAYEHIIFYCQSREVCAYAFLENLLLAASSRGKCQTLLLSSYYGIFPVKEELVKKHKTMTLMKSNSFDETICPVARTAEIISGKWTLLIIRDLASGVKRFNQLERSLQGISPKTLSGRLRSLEEEGIVARQTFAEVPPRVEYSLTEKGYDLVYVIENMRDYGKRWLCNN